MRPDSFCVFFLHKRTKANFSCFQDLSNMKYYSMRSNISLEFVMQMSSHYTSDIYYPDVVIYSLSLSQTHMDHKTTKVAEDQKSSDTKLLYTWEGVVIDENYQFQKIPYRPRYCESLGKMRL